MLLIATRVLLKVSKMFKLVLILWMTFLNSQTICQSENNFFRYDYTYLKDMSTFYKIHTVSKSWNEAKQRCELEGASLFFPEDQQEVESIIGFWNQTQPFDAVYIGISDLLTKEVYTTVNGDAIKDVYSKWAPGEPNNSNGNEDCLVLTREGTLKDEQCNKGYPFICKKPLVSLKWNTLCNIPDLDYDYDDELGRCYKFHAKALSWAEAALVCAIEQSYLAIPNSEEEAKILSRISANSVGTNDITSNSCNSIALGISNKSNEGWKTVLGAKLNDSGYARWADNYPSADQTEQCGFMSYDGLLKSLSCETKCYFICEHENPLLGSLDERTGTF